MSTHKIICSGCREPAERVGEPETDTDMIVCKACGTQADFESVMSSLQEQAADYAGDRIMAGLAAGVRGSKSFKVVTNHRVKKVHPFTVDFEHVSSTDDEDTADDRSDG